MFPYMYDTMRCRLLSQHIIHVVTIRAKCLTDKKISRSTTQHLDQISNHLQEQHGCLNRAYSEEGQWGYPFPHNLKNKETNRGKRKKGGKSSNQPEFRRRPWFQRLLTKMRPGSLCSPRRGCRTPWNTIGEAGTVPGRVADPAGFRPDPDPTFKRKPDPSTGPTL